MSNLSKQEQFLLAEFKEVSSYIKSYWNKRVSVLGVGISFIGLLIAQLSDKNIDFPFIIAGEVGICFILVALTSILESLSKRIYYFIYYITKISKTFGIKGYWDVWLEIMKKKEKKKRTIMLNKTIDTGTKVFRIILLVLNGSVFIIFGVLNINFNQDECFDNKSILWWYLFNLVLFMFLMGWFLRIYKVVNSKNFKKDVKKGVSKYL